MQQQASVVGQHSDTRSRPARSHEGAFEGSACPNFNVPRKNFFKRMIKTQILLP